MASASHQQPTQTGTLAEVIDARLACSDNAIATQLVSGPLNLVQHDRGEPLGSILVVV